MGLPNDTFQSLPMRTKDPPLHLERSTNFMVISLPCHTRSSQMALLFWAECLLSVHVMALFSRLIEAGDVCAGRCLAQDGQAQGPSQKQESIHSSVSKEPASSGSLASVRGQGGACPECTSALVAPGESEAPRLPTASSVCHAAWDGPGLSLRLPWSGPKVGSWAPGKSPASTGPGKPGWPRRLPWFHSVHCRFARAK